MEVEKSSLDKKLLSHARKSPMEIAELTGLEPGYVAERITYLLDSKDWLSDRQEERLLLMEAVSLKDKANDMLDQVEDPNGFAAVANVVLRSLKLMSERLDSRRKLVDDDINRITTAHAKIFAEAFDSALQHIIAGFRAFDGVPENEDIDNLVVEGLKRARKILDGSLL